MRDLFDADLPPSAWREVPQALFLSWSTARQLAYCAARDRDAALHCETLEEARWFQQRAEMYKEMTDATS